MTFLYRPLIALLVVLSSLSNIAFAERLLRATPILKIAAVSEPPLKMAANNQFSGVDIDITKEIFRRMGVPIEFFLLENGARMLQLAEDGYFDLLLAVSKTKDRQGFLIYPNQSYLNISWNFFVLSEKKDILEYEQLSDLKKINIGATLGYSYVPILEKAGLKLTTLTRNELQLPMLLKGRIDASPMNTVTTLYQMKQEGLENQLRFLSKPLSTKQYYNAFTKNSSYPKLQDLVIMYDQTLRELFNEGFVQQVFVRYSLEQYLPIVEEQFRH